MSCAKQGLNEMGAPISSQFVATDTASTETIWIPIGNFDQEGPLNQEALEAGILSLPELTDSLETSQGLYDEAYLHHLIAKQGVANGMIAPGLMITAPMTASGRNNMNQVLRQQGTQDPQKLSAGLAPHSRSQMPINHLFMASSGMMAAVDLALLTQTEWDDPFSVTQSSIIAGDFVFEGAYFVSARGFANSYGLMAEGRMKEATAGFQSASRWNIVANGMRFILAGGTLYLELQRASTEGTSVNGSTIVNSAVQMADAGSQSLYSYYRLSEAARFARSGNQQLDQALVHMRLVRPMGMWQNGIIGLSVVGGVVGLSHEVPRLVDAITNEDLEPKARVEQGLSSGLGTAASVLFVLGGACVILAVASTGPVGIVVAGSAMTGLQGAGVTMTAVGTGLIVLQTAVDYHEPI